jgi:hypothetical protein
VLSKAFGRHADCDKINAEKAKCKSIFARCGSEADYSWALAQIAPYFELEPEPGSSATALLAALIEQYEVPDWPIVPTGSLSPLTQPN